jgi:hypothetical protein
MNKLCFVLALILLALTTPGRPESPVPSGTGQSLSMAPGARVVGISRELSGEPSIAVNPGKPQQVVVVYSPPGAAHSEDGGQTWSQPVSLVPPNYKHSSDVSVTFDTRGHAILCYIAQDSFRTPWYWGHEASRNGLFVRRSLDGGKNWEADPIPVVEYPTQQPGVPLIDKPYIVADNTNSRFAGNLYAGWTDYSLTQSAIQISRSMDGGQTWSKPLRISTHAGLPRGNDGAVVGFSGAVGADGTVYAVWVDRQRVAFTSSRDGGRTFTPARFVIDVGSLFIPLANGGNANGLPVLGIDPRPGHGRLFLTWSDYRNGDVDVFCSTSDDRGQHWTLPVRVNTDSVHNGIDQFLQWLAVDPVTGAANVVFYDRRDDPENRRINVELGRSVDGGRTFVNYCWTNQSFDSYDSGIADYTGITAWNGRVYGAWTEVTAPPEPAKEGEDLAAADLRLHLVVRVGVADFTQ